jgi:8-oxo-dGTP diphosphatase
MEEKVLKKATVVYLLKDGKVLLAKKPRSEGGERKIGEGAWNGYGGGVEGNESLREATVRELREEAGVASEPSNLKLKGIVHCHNKKDTGGEFVLELFAYVLDSWTGEPKETEEMKTPTWFLPQGVPWEEMMPPDQDWLPHVLAGKHVRASTYMLKGQTAKYRESEVEIVPGFPED